MKTKRAFQESDLAALAKKFREKTGKSKADMARELAVHPTTIQLAEEYPERSMTRMRCRIIEACSPFRVDGPGYWLERK